MTVATAPAPASAPAKIPAVPPLPDPAPLPPAIMDRGDGAADGTLVQLGAWRQEAEATQAWDRAVKRAGGELAGLSPNVVAVDLPGRGRYYRLRVRSDSGAAKLCASLAAKGLDCLPVRD